MMEDDTVADPPAKGSARRAAPAPLDDHQAGMMPGMAAETAAPAPREPAPVQPPPDLSPVTVLLDAHFAAWLCARAEAHGQTPAEHAGAVLRQFWAAHDQWRHTQSGAPTRPAGAR
jgi:hypothetical protein